MFKVGDKVKVVNVKVVDGESYDEYLNRDGVILLDCGEGEPYRWYVHFRKDIIPSECFDSDELQLLEDKPCTVTKTSTEKN